MKKPSKRSRKSSLKAEKVFLKAKGKRIPSSKQVDRPSSSPKGQNGNKGSQSSFPIVGIGASAGGLDAFIELFRKLPPKTGMAFVLVQHLSPQHMSLLSSFVQKATQMQVLEAKEGTEVEPNHVYVIPPNSLLEIFHRKLRLSPMGGQHGVAMPVNLFFNSLAHDCGNLAIGVVLSGNGSDGAHGMREIKAEGGLTLVQQPRQAKYDGMPKAAIMLGVADQVLALEELAQELARISTHPLVKKVATEEREPSPENQLQLQKIFMLVRRIKKIDFSLYKYPTMIRRIKRRMVLHKIETLKHYYNFLENTPNEVRALFDDLLINVTDFFRDPETFEVLKTSVFQEILKDRPPNVPIRIWVPGCASGEEVYSIAIVLLEFLGDSLSRIPIQIYGTDICEPAINIARAGLYPHSISQSVSAGRLQRYFVKEQGGYRISRIIRDLCIFSLQDVTSQPPINRLDLLSCRNLMIYLGPILQKRVMDTFYYALNPKGFLLLGSSESISSAATLFTVVDKKSKIYLKRSAPIPLRLEFTGTSPQLEGLEPPTSTSGGGGLKNPVKPRDPIAEAENTVLEHFAPPWVLINQALDIVQFRGMTGYYLAPASGHPSWNLIKMLREGLLPDIRVLVHTVFKESEVARKEGLTVKFNGHIRTIDVVAAPISVSGLEPHCLILFIEKAIQPLRSEGGRKKKLDRTQRKGQDPELARLRAELISTQKSLQSIIEDQNSTNEELQSANEEVLSANEELQSTNEELETAKEELQSTNEELTTLNEELLNRNVELAQANNDLVNVLTNANVPIVLVGGDLRIRRFTPLAEKILKLIATDVGRSLMDINHGLKVENLQSRICEAVDAISTVEFEAQGWDGHWYLVRIRPYKTVDNKIDGAVIILIDIDSIKGKEERA